jgi:poly(A) polymerase/tRNA nucleotidyltransferase (CCA-adding enzyme)
VKLEERVIAWLASQNADAYLVGGCVRDRLLDRAIYDLDVSIPGDGCALARRLADRFGADYYTLDSERRTGRAILRREDGERLYVDVAHFRGENLAEDLAGRDFTINALATDVAFPEIVIDRHGGLADLEAGLLRPVSDTAIRDDPLRALRAIRLAAQLDFALAKETEELVRRDGAALADVAAERLCDELSKLLACTSSSPFLDELDRFGLLGAILPELEPLRKLEQPPPHRYRALKHTLESVRAFEVLLDAIGCAPAGRNASDVAAIAGVIYLDNLPAYAAQLRRHLGGVVSGERPRVVLLKLALLLHDVGKPGTLSVEEGGRIRFLRHEDVGAEMAGEALARLRYSSAEVRLVECIVRNHMRPLMLASQDGVSSRAVYRFFRDTEDAGIDILLHALADHLATCAFEAEESDWHGLVDLVTRMLGCQLDRGADQPKQPSLLTGHDLLRDFGLPPGPQIGELLEAVREAQAVGEVRTRDEAMGLVRTLLNR